MINALIRGGFLMDIPEITNWVLEQLSQYNAKGTFFCIGKNIINHPDILKNIEIKTFTIEEQEKIITYFNNNKMNSLVKVAIILSCVFATLIVNGQKEEIITLETSDCNIEGTLLIPDNTSESPLAIIIAGMGLFGLTSFTVEQRTKEIGVRKAMGSSVPEIFFVISREVLILVSISALIASIIPLVFLLTK